MSEASEIKRIGATPIKNSGRGTKKGDALLGPFLLDIKEYEEGFRVTRTNWAKASKDANSRNDGSQPMFLLALRPKGTDPERTTPIRVWVVGEAMGKEMLEAWEEKYGREG